MKSVGAGGLEMKDALMLHMFGKLTKGVGAKGLNLKDAGWDDEGDDLLEMMKNESLQSMKR